MYRIFISHSWAYSSDYDKIESFLRQEGIVFYNHSVPKNDPIHTNGTDKQLSDAIEAKVKGAVALSFLQEFMPLIANGLIKRLKWQRSTTNLSLLFSHGEQNASSIVKNAADVIVGWNAKSVANAVRNYAIYQSL